MARVLDLPGYRRFWAASSVSIVGSYVTSLALKYLAVHSLHANALQLGLLDAAGWAPYLLFGLFAGVLVDRYKRKPILVTADLARAVLLCVLPTLYFLDLLTLPALGLFAAVFGLLSLAFDAADQSYLPRLVPRELLTAANARLGQSDAVAQTAGPLLGGVLLAVFVAPIAILFDALSYLVSGLLLLSIRDTEPAPAPAADRDLWGELRAGLSWVYRHRTLASQSIASHGWFVFNSMLSVAFVTYVLQEDQLNLGGFGLGTAMACGGVGAVLGAAAAGWAGRRFGVGWTVVLGHLLQPLPWILVAVSAPGPLALAWVGVAQFCYWATVGLVSPNEMAYRQAVTPDELQGRMNATIRSINRAMIVVGGPVGGLLVLRIGFHATFWVGIAGLAVTAIYLLLSPYRTAVHEDALVS